MSVWMVHVVHAMCLAQLTAEVSEMRGVGGVYEFGSERCRTWGGVSNKRIVLGLYQACGNMGNVCLCSILKNNVS